MLIFRLSDLFHFLYFLHNYEFHAFTIVTNISINIWINKAL